MLAETLLPLGLSLGEGALAIASESFLFIDIRTGRVFEGSVNGTSSQIAEFEDTVGAVATTRSGGIIVAGRHSVLSLDGTVDIALPPQAADVRMNDSKADPVGRFVCGTMAEPPRAGAGGLWSFGTDGVSQLLDDVTISNGLCWSAAGDVLYYIDTPTQRVDRCDYDVTTGQLDGRRPLAVIDEAAGSPDGMTIDDEGGLWVALWGGSAVHRYIDGRLDHVVEVPTPFVTSAAIVDRSLVITTAREAAPDDPLAGHLFRAEVGVSAPLPHAVDLELLGP